MLHPSVYHISLNVCLHAILCYTLTAGDNFKVSECKQNKIVPMKSCLWWSHISSATVSMHITFTCWPVSGQISKQSSNLYIACCTVCKCSGRNLLFTRGRTSASGYSIVVWCMSVCNMWVCLPVYNYIIWMPSGGLGFLKEGFQLASIPGRLKYGLVPIAGVIVRMR